MDVDAKRRRTRNIACDDFSSSLSVLSESTKRKVWMRNTNGVTSCKSQYTESGLSIEAVKERIKG